MHSVSERDRKRRDRELFGEILASVSRSFYLTLRVLPSALRRPIGLAYLLARASDTLADSAGGDSATRIAALTQFGGALEGRASLPSAELLAELQEGISSASERRLLTQLPALLVLLEGTAPEDRAEILKVLAVIIEGQRLDLVRFPDSEQLRSLETMAELDDYTFRVAGCVGEFWTRLCFRHLNGYSRLGLDEAVSLGIRLGKGLQWINILRDAPEDLANGRCYFPREDLAEAGLTPDSLLAKPERARLLFGHWISTARGHLESGRLYIRAIRTPRLRLACYLPWAIGEQTLDLLEKEPPLETQERVKISRNKVRGIVAKGFLALISNIPLK